MNDRYPRVAVFADGTRHMFLGLDPMVMAYGTEHEKAAALYAQARAIQMLEDSGGHVEWSDEGGKA